jgi:TolA-binding protein
MCNPVAFAAVSMVIAAAGTAASIYQSNKAADAAQDAAEKEAALARQAEEKQIEALNAQLEQETDKTEIQKLERQRQALRERAKIRVAESESGAFGNSTLKQLSASMVNEGQDKGLMDYNLRATADQIERQKDATSINTSRQINNAFASVPIKPSAFMSGLSIGSSAAGGAMQGYSMGGGDFSEFSAGGAEPTDLSQARWSPRQSSGMG